MTDELSILAEGIPPYTRNTRRKVAIVGAGMAGLVTAWVLRRAGYDVRILEASHRVGGRVHTLRSGFSSGLYAERGAMRIPAEHALTLWQVWGLSEQLPQSLQCHVKTSVRASVVRNFGSMPSASTRQLLVIPLRHPTILELLVTAAWRRPASTRMLSTEVGLE